MLEIFLGVEVDENAAELFQSFPSKLRHLPNNSKGEKKSFSLERLKMKKIRRIKLSGS